MNTQKRSKFRPNPTLSTHSTYKNLRAAWFQTNHWTTLECFHTRAFTPAHFLKPLELASRTNTSLNDACMTYRAQGIPCPSEETVLRQCRQEGGEWMELHLNHALETQFIALPGKLRRQYRKHGIVLIDFHLDPYYGQPNNPNVVVGPRKHGTTRFYSYLTADLLTPRGQHTIAVVHRSPGESLFDLFWDLLTRVEFLLTPKLLFFDGELATVQILASLHEKGYPYIARKRISPRLRPLALAYSLTDDWERKRTFQAVTLLDKTKTVETTVYVTFQRCGNDMKALIISPLLQLTPQEAEQEYRKRFAIETGYRDKHCLQGRTTSTHLAVRLVLFGMACMLWNLWRTFLMLGPDPTQGTLSRVGRWRRRLRAINRFVLRDEFLGAEMGRARR